RPSPTLSVATTITWPSRIPDVTVPDRSLFVDTSGWADPVLRNTPDHPAMEAFYSVYQRPPFYSGRLRTSAVVRAAGAKLVGGCGALTIRPALHSMRTAYETPS